jgi:hypothetical protein
MTHPIFDEILESIAPHDFATNSDYDLRISGICAACKTQHAPPVLTGVTTRNSAEATEWSGSCDPCDPANYWIDDETDERISAATGERTLHDCPMADQKGE